MLKCVLPESNLLIASRYIDAMMFPPFAFSFRDEKGYKFDPSEKIKFL